MRKFISGLFTVTILSSTAFAMSSAHISVSHVSEPSHVSSVSEAHTSASSHVSEDSSHSSASTHDGNSDKQKPASFNVSPWHGNASVTPQGEQCDKEHRENCKGDE